MRDIMGMMKEMAGLKARMEAMQAELDETFVEGQSGAGLVKVTLTAKGALKAVSIDPELLKPEDREMVEDLLLAAHADARVKTESVIAEKMQALTGGLPMPPGFKLPF
ncbi:MAG: YbaB/EbfC family nucleoid-associated protein [Methylobacterium sp.]|nr:YbaB/EbfC family nucleoid-associated protein [Methylobacterium sp.]MCA3606942.1 YbaB/EbfC family nucleoid-associated protein [Methylobacterium sp.]MCA3610440.1 YbaB/EbfC family nucleoid-associated protein [Methylobacterium sp.]MCA3611999.1 YbaB/EbfC family nucleoid-associated protein [Methylobacterium sp.]MCA3617277.1 YbaB/EbfC family nucleoid-associated protein [Methylobacterium sp.]